MQIFRARISTPVLPRFPLLWEILGLLLRPIAVLTMWLRGGYIDDEAWDRIEHPQQLADLGRKDV